MKSAAMYGWAWLQPERNSDGAFVIPKEEMTAFRHRSLRRADPLSRMVCSAASKAATEAGWVDAGAGSPERVHHYLATELGPTEDTRRYLAKVRDHGAHLADPAVFPNLVVSAPLGYASLAFGWTGTSCTFAQHGVGVAQAVDRALRDLHFGRADAVMVSGAEEWSIARAQTEQMLSVAGQSRRGHPPRVAPGMGAGAFVLGPLSHGTPGIRIYAPLFTRQPDVAATRFRCSPTVLGTLWKELVTEHGFQAAMVDRWVPAHAWSAEMGELECAQMVFPSAEIVDLDSTMGQWPSRTVVAIAKAAELVRCGDAKLVLVSLLGRGGEAAALLIGDA